MCLEAPFLQFACLEAHFIQFACLEAPFVQFACLEAHFIQFACLEAHFVGRKGQNEVGTKGSVDRKKTGSLLFSFQPAPLDLLCLFWCVNRSL